MKKVVWNILFYSGFALLIFSSVFSQFLSDSVSSPVINFILGFAIAIMLVGLTFMFINRYSTEGAKQYEIDDKDERNIRIKEKASYITMFVAYGLIGLLAFAFLFMGYRDVAFITVAGAVVLRIVYEIFKVIYNKKM